MIVTISFLVPYAGLIDVVKNVFNEHPEKDLIKLYVLPRKSDEIDAADFKGDVVIARGITASAVKQFGIDIPLVEIPVTGYDIMKAVDACKQKFNAKKILCVGPPSINYGINVIADIMKVSLSSSIINCRDDAERVVKTLSSGQFDAIIGGLSISEMAQKRGIPNILIESGPEAIRQVLDEAIRAAAITREERARVERFRAIMDYSHEGIVAIDEKSKVTLFNKAAREIAEIGDGACMGCSIEDILPSIKLRDILKEKKEELEGLYQIQSSMVTANRIPIRVDGKVLGAVATFQKVSRIQEIEEKIRKKIHTKGLSAKYNFSDILGNSRVLLEAVEVAKEFSAAESNVLIIGETGTGKELFAQSIHNNSPRKNGPFVAINCAAIPEHLLESELFGYVEGAFTGAVKGGKAGLFELAHNGTIFLDEISELSPALQGRLLRVLQEKEIMRLGHDRMIPVNVRILAASNKYLNNLVRKGEFRQDILYRLDVLRISIPPLRNRREDIPLFIEAFLQKLANQGPSRRPVLSEKALKMLTEYSWPGNVRELINICERLYILSKGKKIDTDLIVKVMDTREPSFYEDAEFGAGTDFRKAERDVLLEVLHQTNNDKKEAAEILGIDGSTLWRKLKKHGIHLS